MIVELFGPPAAGKTTLADALVIALRKNGCDVQHIASSRPAEIRLNKNECTNTVRRRPFPLAAPLSRAVKLASAVPTMLPGARNDDTGALLMELLPSRGLFRWVRNRRYLSLLRQSWNMVSASKGVAILDQGYISALCSLALRTRSPDARSLARGLELVPRPNLLICLDAPREVLRARLFERLRRQGAVERMFELDLDTNLKQAEIVRRVAGMLRDQDWPMIDVSCLDQRQLEEVVDQIVLSIAVQREDVRNERQA
jgi:thymidylate kinase